LGLTISPGQIEHLSQRGEKENTVSKSSVPFLLMLSSFCRATKSCRNDYWRAKGIIVNIDILVSFMRLFDCTERELKDGCCEVY